MEVVISYSSTSQAWVLLSPKWIFWQYPKSSERNFRAPQLLIFLKKNGFWKLSQSVVPSAKTKYLVRKFGGSGLCNMQWSNLQLVSYLNRKKLQTLKVMHTLFWYFYMTIFPRFFHQLFNYYIIFLHVDSSIKFCQLSSIWVTVMWPS